MNEEEQARYKAILTEYSKLYTENKKLKDKVSYLKERVAYLERSNNRREETILYLREENNELHNKIVKAIVYIENADWYLPLWECRDNQPNKQDLLEILKDNE